VAARTDRTTLEAIRMHLRLLRSLHSKVVKAIESTENIKAAVARQEGMNARQAAREGDRVRGSRTAAE
jgi:hypothetical protein